MVSYTPSNEDVRLYECAVLYPYPFSQKEESELLKAIEGIFADAAGKQIFKDSWGQRGLAYPIGGFEDANFVIYYYELDPSKIKEIDEQLSILKNLLRHLIVKPVKGYEIRSYADTEKRWKEQSRIETERAKQEKEDRLKKQVIDKARRQTKKKPEDAPVKKKVSGESIDKQLDKLISDDDLDI